MLAMLRPSPLATYKSWVRRHPGIVNNLDWLLYLGTWSPSRLSGSDTGPSSELRYEAYHALVGLLSVWHTHILEEGSGAAQLRGPYGIWLDLLEQVEVLVELRAIQLERMGKMSRYSPLLLLEGAKALLKLLMWGRYSGHLFLRHPGPEDFDLMESRQGLQDIVGALARLQERYEVLVPFAHAAKPSCSGDDDTLSTLSTQIPTLLSPLASALGAVAYLPAHALGAWAGGLTAAARGALGLGSSSGRSGSGRSGDSCKAGSSGSGGSEGSGGVGSRGGSGDGGGQHQDSSIGKGGSQSGSGGDGGGGGGSSIRGSSSIRGGGGGGGSSYLSGPGMDEASQRRRLGSNLVWLGEVLHITRPVAYVAMLRRHGRSSWQPWTGSLLMDLLSAYFQSRGMWHMGEAASPAQSAAASAGAASQQPAAGAGAGAGAEAGAGAGAGAEAGAGAGAGAHGSGAAGDPFQEQAGREAQARGYGTGYADRGTTQYGGRRAPHRPTSLLSLALARSLTAPSWSEGERREIADRRKKLLLYLLRSPCLDVLVRGPLHSLVQASSRVPLAHPLLEYLQGMLETFTEYYTYTAGSS